MREPPKRDDRRRVINDEIRKEKGCRFDRDGYHMRSSQCVFSFVGFFLVVFGVSHQKECGPGFLIQELVTLSISCLGRQQDRGDIRRCC